MTALRAYACSVRPTGRWRLLRAFAILIAGLLAITIAARPAPAHAASTHSVAYVSDFGGGVGDSNFTGSSIFENAIDGAPFASGGSYNGATFTDVPVSALDASPATALSGFDTALLYEVCDIGSHPAAVAALDDFVTNGGKVMLFDGDRCAPGEGGLADYSKFLFPFATSSPGPRGASGSYTRIEASTLTAGLATGAQTGDSVGDSNTFTSNAGGWCASITATNTLGNNGFVEAYARTTAGGLVIYEGEDFWFTFGPTAHLKQVFDLMLAQTFNLDGLPCTTPPSGIKLDPLTATDPVGASQTETATVVDNTGTARATVAVNFVVLSGPDAGLTGSSATDGAGHATFTITNTTAPGTDVVQASFSDSSGTHNSNKTTVVWTARPTTLTYVGATSGDFNDPATLASRLTTSDDGQPVAGATISMRLGAQTACTATTGADGVGSCAVTPNEPAGSVPVHASFAGSGSLLPSATSATFTVTREETALRYTGDTHVANGTPAHLSAVLTEDGVTPIAGRAVAFALGGGASAQACTGTTDGSGTAACDIASVHQPLAGGGSLPVTAAFAGDAFYLPASAQSTVLLQYMTGRAFGLSANVRVLLLTISVPPTPDTGPVATADATTTHTPCTATLQAVVVSAHVLCANVTTSLGPGTSRATATVKDVTIGVPGLPVIRVTGLTATSRTTCGSATGQTTLTLFIGGVQQTVALDRTVVIDLGVARLTLNEQAPVPGADFGLTVNAVHLTGLSGALDVIVGSATSDIHSC